MRKLIVALFIIVSFAPSAHATTGPGCLRITGVADGDVLNMRSSPSASSRVVDKLVPGEHGIIRLDAPCSPLSQPWAERWCKVSHFMGPEVTRGWVKARYVRDNECP